MIIRKMIREELSIREMAKQLGIPKSTLHNRLTKFKKNCEDEELLIGYDCLLTENKKVSPIKGANARWHK